MAYQVSTRTSYGNRLSESLKGVVTGFIMFIAGTVLLFWNEGNFVKTRKSIAEAQGVVVRVDDVSTINPELNGKLIHATAFADTQDMLEDEMFGVNERAIALNREVEYYQYVESSKTETRDRIGGGQEKITTYEYELKWVSQPVNSSNFQDPTYRSVNFVQKNVESRKLQAQNVSFGGYKLPSFMVSSISGNAPVEVNVTPEEEVQVFGNTVYYGPSSNNPQVGDVRVTITKVVPTNISIIGKVFNNTFEQYVAKNGKSFSKVSMGEVSADNMFAEAHSANSMWTWILRIVGILVVVMGLKSLFGILPALFKVLPFLGNIVGAGVGLVCVVGGGAWSLLVISLAWLFYRPLVGIPLLVLSVLGIWYLSKKAKAKKGGEKV